MGDQGAMASTEQVSPSLLKDRLVDLVYNSVASPHSKRSYARGVADFVDWARLEDEKDFTLEISNRYVSYLEGLHGAHRIASATVNLRLSPVRKLAKLLASTGRMDGNTATSIREIRSSRESQHQRQGNWLTRKQVGDLLDSPDSTTVSGLRDRAIIAILIYCGLRRTELSELEVQQIRQVDGRWGLIDIVGKRGKIRSVALPTPAKAFLDEWLHVSGVTDGRLFRAVMRDGNISESITASSIWDLVQKHSKEAGIQHLTPHDLRRTCAKLCRNGGGKIEQIQHMLGHTSIQTTEKYLGTQPDWDLSPNDLLGEFGSNI